MTTPYGKTVLFSSVASSMFRYGAQLVSVHSTGERSIANEFWHSCYDFFATYNLSLSVDVSFLELTPKVGFVVDSSGRVSECFAVPILYQFVACLVFLHAKVS